MWPLMQQTNAFFRAACDDNPLLTYVDVATPMIDASGAIRPELFIEDNLHLNDLGNAIWGATIKAALMPMEARLESALQ